MPALVLKLTDAGLAAVQAASGSDPTTIGTLGLTGTPFDYAPTLTALPGEFKRLDIASGIASAPNVTHLTAYDTSAETWTATGLGLFLADGTLFAVHISNQPLMNKVGLAFGLFAFDIAFEADFAANISYGNAVFAYPMATEFVPGIAEIATQDAVELGADDRRFVTPKKLLQRLQAILQSIANEVAARAAAVIALGQRVDAEAGTRSQADTALGGRIDNEALARTQADTALGSRIDGEAQARAGADAALGGRIDGEAAARSGADNTLSGAIAAEEAARFAADNALAQDIATEATARGNVDVALQDQLDWLKARTVTGKGLVTGGGALNENNELTVTEASTAEVTAGLRADVVVTPRRLGPISMQLAQNGFIRFFGFQINWGRFTASANGTTVVPFARSFETACFSAVCSGVTAGGADSQDNPPAVIASSINVNGFSAFSADDTADPTCYIAVGT